MKKNLVLIGVFGLLVLAGVAAPRAGITPGGGPVSQLVEKAHSLLRAETYTECVMDRGIEACRHLSVNTNYTPPRTSAPTSGEACARGLSLANRTVAVRS